VASLMGRSPRVLALVLVTAALSGACGTTGTSTTASPATAASAGLGSPSSAATAPVPVTGAFGALVSSWYLGGSSYTVSLVGVDGRVVASAAASAPGTFQCPNGGAVAAVQAPVSTSNTRLYFMDALGVVRFLAPNGDTGQIITLPIGPTLRSMFAVSPDDRRIAVIAADFNSSGATTTLYVEDLNGGGNRVTPFNETGAFTLWPAGWHGMNNLVLAKMPSCTGPSCCGPVELHVVDATTADRRVTIGGPNCAIVGTPSPGGAVCEDPQFQVATIFNWAGTQIGGFPIGGPTQAYVSPDGQHVAVAPIGPGLSTSIFRTNTTLNLEACGWIDDSHVIAPGDTQSQSRVGDITNGNLVSVAALGYCAGRIPGGL
jgi:hypothetical protein